MKHLIFWGIALLLNYIAFLHGETPEWAKPILGISTVLAWLTFTIIFFTL